MDKPILEFIRSKTNLSEKSIINTVSLLDQGATIPFISRYRKERTGSLDEVGVADISSNYSIVKELITRKEYIISTIREQGNLTDKLRQQLQSTWDPTLLEDLYLPYKRKKTTKAAVARAAGLEDLAEIIFRSRTRNLNQSARQFINKKVNSTEDALSGARDIIAENISEHKVSREIARDVFKRTARLTSKLIKSKEAEAEKYKNYFDISQSLLKIPSHRLLAMYRGEEEKFLRVKIEIDDERLQSRLFRYFIKEDNQCSEQVELAIQDSLKRLIIPSISNEFRKEAKAKADDEAIDVFSENLRQLLLAAPLGEQSILAIDPGFRSGCKLAAINKKGKYLATKTIFPHPPISKTQDAEYSVLQHIEKYNIEAIAVGNGTAGRESMKWLKGFVPEHIEIYLVNESGASIYSASDLAREEFPDLDLTVRGAISIGRRLMDPLAELVKIDAKSIGVGQYQHDVNQPKLKQKLDQVVINCVNKVGINLNTASYHLLSYVSGLGPTLAQNIVKYRSQEGGISSRKELQKVPRMGAKAFEQAAGFLRVKEGVNPLDNTGVHPESYKIVAKMAKSQGVAVEELISNEELIKNIQLSDFITEKVGMPTLKDIVQELRKPGIDPRGAAEVFHFTEGINTIGDLRVGNKVKGVVNNLTKFGAFVDIGIKESALIHISQITNKFIKDPSEVLSLGQEIEGLIMDLDVPRKRISLTLKF
ncbi:RNA-binding transcriptional accessory protein [Saprospiraceae bacterium]|nr:RNA-binding transcriptional accessory protein [Saprospiraceae bacterium]